MIKDNPITDNPIGKHQLKKYPKAIEKELEKLKTVDFRIKPKHSRKSSYLNITLLPTTEQQKRIRKKRTKPTNHARESK